MIAGAIAIHGDENYPPFMQAEDGQIVIDKANEFLKKESEFVKDPPEDATAESLENLESELYRMKDQAWAIADRLRSVYRFKSLNDPVSGIDGFKGKTANDLLVFFNQKEKDTQAKFERFQNARKDAENSVYRKQSCENNGFDSLKAGEKIGVTEPDKLGIYWIATVVRPKSGSYLLTYDYKGKQAEEVLANCDYLAKLDDKTKDIRKFKNVAEAGAVFGTAANSKYQADLDNKYCGSGAWKYNEKTGKCIKRK